MIATQSNGFAHSQPTHLSTDSTTTSSSTADEDSKMALKTKMANGNTTQQPNDTAAETEDHSIGAALYVATSVLQQGLDFLKTSLTDETQLVYESKLLPGSTIGKHLRHARDHFNLLAQCIAQPPPLTLSYDIRTRDTPMERSLPAAVTCLQTSIDDLNSLLSTDAREGSLDHGGREPRLSNDTPITLNAVTPFPQTFNTSLGRELWFVALHAIHHYAVVRILAGELELTVDDTFGVAPSTLRYRNHGDEDPEKARI